MIQASKGNSTNETMETARAKVSDLADAYAVTPGGLLPLLHEIQHTFGYISEEAIAIIASALNLSRAEVSGVVSFYHDFRRVPDPRPSLKLCRAEACQARGSERLAEYVARLVGNRVRIDTVYCLGLCSAGPNAMVGDEVHARLNEESLGELVAAL